MCPLRHLRLKFVLVCGSATAWCPCVGVGVVLVNLVRICAYPCLGFCLTAVCLCVQTAHTHLFQRSISSMHAPPCRRSSELTRSMWLGRCPCECMDMLYNRGAVILLRLWNASRHSQGHRGHSVATSRNLGLAHPLHLMQGVCQPQTNSSCDSLALLLCMSGWFRGAHFRDVPTSF